MRWFKIFLFLSILVQTNNTLSAQNLAVKESKEINVPPRTDATKSIHLSIYIYKVGAFFDLLGRTPPRPLALEG